MREGWPICKSWKFKVVHSEPVFDTGSMPGLIKLFRRHSGFSTNFRIFSLESRLIGSGRAILSARSHGVRRGSAGALECHGGRRPAGQIVVGPWQYQCTPGCRLGGYRRVLYRVLPLPPTRYCTTPGTTPPTAPSTLQSTGCTDTRFESIQGDPRGWNTHRYTRAR